MYSTFYKENVGSNIDLNKLENEQILLQMKIKKYQEELERKKKQEQYIQQMLIEKEKKKQENKIKVLQNVDIPTISAKTNVLKKTTSKVTSSFSNEPEEIGNTQNKQMEKLVDTIFTSLNAELKEDNEIFQNDVETVIRKNSKGKEIKLKAKLYPYQKQGLNFLKSNEHKDNEIKGGLLCDEMGLGKTIQVISLLLAKPKSLLGDIPMELPEGVEIECKATLIVSPVSTLEQW